MKITFLGTGTSHGVPSLDCIIDNHVRCKKNVCRESQADPLHYRTRSSILVEYNSRSILIDVSLDFREQALRERIAHIDAVLLTHKHSDHIGGIPDIRSYAKNPEMPLPIYGSGETMAGVKESFSYIFDRNTFVGGGIPLIKLNDISGPFSLFDFPVEPLPVHHGSLSGCIGYRLGKCAYIPDMKSMDDQVKKRLTGIDCLIVNCLRDERPHSTHMIMSESMDFAREIGPAKCYFIHMCHDIHYKIDGKKLDPWMSFAYDGQTITLEDNHGTV